MTICQTDSDSGFSLLFDRLLIGCIKSPSSKDSADQMKKQPKFGFLLQPTRFIIFSLIASLIANLKTFELIHL